jgi:hypothetical protein
MRIENASFKTFRLGRAIWTRDVCKLQVPVAPLYPIPRIRKLAAAGHSIWDRRPRQQNFQQMHTLSRLQLCISFVRAGVVGRKVPMRPKSIRSWACLE